MGTEENSCQLEIFVKTNAKENRIKVYEDSLDVWIAEIPSKGKANKEIVRYLSDILGLSSQEVRIIRGRKSTTKTILITSLSRKNAMEQFTKFQLTQMKQ